MARKKSSSLTLIVNPGGSSTKIAVSRGHRLLFKTNREHPYKKLASLKTPDREAEYRKNIITREVSRSGYSLRDIRIHMARGGLLRPVKSGVYAVNDRMLQDLRSSRYGRHASNLGAIIITKLAKKNNAPCFIADPVVVDERIETAAVTGLPGIERRSIFHALSQKAVADKACARRGLPAEKTNLIVAHVGSGVSVGVHRKGRVIDVNNALEGDGPFSPERTGSLPLFEFYRYVKKNRLSEAAVYRLITKQGGLFAHLGTNDCRTIENRIAGGDKTCEQIYDAFVLQVAKAISAGAAVLAGKVDAVVLTGNVLKARRFQRSLRRRIRFIAPVMVFTDNSEMQALAQAAEGVCSGTRKEKEY